ncbi:hypothetical protein F4604DRAFT_1674991 [Suillus subluteus]|nr:hypothetical protein F4604DRAFT_1674991 [Suillus subluteus]
MSSKNLVDEFVAGWYLVHFMSMSVSGSAALSSAGPTSSQKWKKNPKLNSYSHTSKPSGIQQHQHTQYQVHRDGSISYTQSYVEPPNNAQPTTQPKLTTSALIPNQFDNFLADGSWDVDTMPLDDNQPVRRRQTAGREKRAEGMCGKVKCENARCVGRRKCEKAKSYRLMLGPQDDDGYMRCMELTGDRWARSQIGSTLSMDIPRDWLDDGWMLLDDARCNALKREKVRKAHARECCALCGKVARLWRVSWESCALYVE